MRDHGGGWGEYVIRVESLEDGSIEGIQLREDGTDYSHQETVDWPIRNPHVQVEVEKLDIRIGDVVSVAVEFERYTVIEVEHFTLHPRRLHDRLLRIENHLGLS
ncbi:hypothetical protein SEA_MAGRITTE_229 [Microbacterium phage Magritte]|nr:hypothetical protein SEA_MAGRITTE_229 [Microbacterium phage Magritte]